MISESRTLIRLLSVLAEEKRRVGTKLLWLSTWAFLAVEAPETTPRKALGDPTARVARGITDEETLRSMEYDAILVALLLLVRVLKEGFGAVGQYNCYVR
jgi:hypothetical protein